MDSTKRHYCEYEGSKDQFYGMLVHDFCAFADFLLIRHLIRGKGKEIKK
jgi:hypothetical protein